MKPEEKRITLVRHSQSTHNREQLWAGWQDPPLTEKGRSDAWYAAAHWKHSDITATTSSDLRRAAEGAIIIAENLHIPNLPGDQRLRERNAGEWQGRRTEELQDDTRYKEWKKEPRSTPPGGEDWDHFVHRIEEGIRDVLNSTEPHTLAVVHDGVMQALAHELKAPIHPCRPLTQGVTLTLKEGKLTFGSKKTSCEVCRIRDEPAPDGHLKILTAHTLVNSYRNSEAEPDRGGWIIVSPRRHVTRWHQLDMKGAEEIVRLARAVDAVLTLNAGARRVMVASLGWETEAHLHTHLVPTFDPEVTGGYLNFDGRYRAGSHLPQDLNELIERAIRREIQNTP